MQKLVKPSRLVYNESLKDVIAYNDEDDDPGLCTAGKVFGVAAVVFGAAFLFSSGGLATPAGVWLASYATTSGLFASTIALAC